MRTSLRVKTLAVVVTASLGGVVAPSVWSVSTVSDNPAVAISAPASVLKTYMVEFAEDGALHYDGGIGTLRGSSQKITGDQNFNSQRVEVQAYVSYLENAIATRTAAISNQLGRSVEVTHRYFYTHAGVAMQLDDSEAQQVRSMSGVKNVVISQDQTLDTFRGPTFIGAPTVWNLAAPGGSTNRGAGVRIAILDSGANSLHPSFANDASCGFSAVTNPKLVAVSCATATGPGGACNGPNPEADAVSSSHGVHTAGTAGGNALTTSTVPAPTLPSPFTAMSGVAPCAGINSYKVCNTPAGQCAGADTIAATNNAIAAVATGIKALNFSISGGTNPWTNGESDRVFLDAINAGIFVAASAGNTSTTVTNPIGAVNHKGPWTMTVANSYHDLNTAAKLSITGPTAPANLQNIIMNKGSTTATGTLLSNAPIKASSANLAGCTDTGAFPAGFFTGSIAVVRRGFNAPGTVACGFLEKINNAVNAGAIAVIITNNQAGAISMDTTGVISTTVPAYSISSQAIGDSLLVPFLNANATATATFDPTGVLPDKLADSSLRGPTAVHVDVTKPDISGPGTGIYAAARDADGSYIYLSGTSMSGPHVAGAGALLRAVRPTWTPTEVKSALQMTAKKDGFKDDGTAPWDIDDAGHGRVDLTKAASAGLVMDETYARFLASNPSGGTINVKELNIPSLRNMACGSSCTFTRTVKSTLSTTANWTASSLSASNLQITVSPATFSIPAGGTQVLTFTVSPPAYGLPIVAPAVGFGYAVLTEAASLSPALHITAAIRGTGDGIFKNGFDGTAGPVVPPTYSEGFEPPTFAVGDLATQAGWFRQYADNWYIQTANPAAGVQHLRGVSDGLGSSAALSPTQAVGTTAFDVASARIAITNTGTGASSDFAPQDPGAALVNTRVRFNRTGNTIQVLQGSPAAYVTIPSVTFPSGYFDFKAIVNRSTLALELCLNNTSIFTGTALAPNIQNVAVFSLMESGSTGSTFDVDNLVINNVATGGCGGSSAPAAINTRVGTEAGSAAAVSAYTQASAKPR